MGKKCGLKGKKQGASKKHGVAKKPAIPKKEKEK